MALAELHYKVHWRTRGGHPGHHASRQRGGGLHFRNHAALIDAPDPRRFDVHASLRDPFEQIQVRVYQQTSAIPVFALADLSASMQFGGKQSKLARVAEFIACLAYSANRTGDRYGFVGCAEQTTPALYSPPSINPAHGQEMAARLRAWSRPCPHADGLLRAADLLGARRALVFLLSDFHFPLAFTERVLASLAYHDVVPVVMWDRAEYLDLPARGLVRLRDPESGRERLLLMRRALKQQIERAYHERRAALLKLCGQYARPPLFLQDAFVPDDVTRYFLG